MEFPAVTISPYPEYGSLTDRKNSHLQTQVPLPLMQQ